MAFTERGVSTRRGWAMARVISEMTQPYGQGVASYSRPYTTSRDPARAQRTGVIGLWGGQRGLQGQTGQPPPDALAPVFAVTPVASAASRTAVNLSWNAATDETTAQGDIVYEIHWSTSGSQPFNVRGKTAAGTIVFTAEDLHPGTTYYFRVRAVDEAGNSTESSEVACTTTADASPSVTLVSPAQGEITADTTIVLRVTDDVGLSAKVILVKYPDGSAEAAWDGSVFSAPFALSTVTPITGGYEIRLARTLGWQQNPQVEFIAVDSAGQVV